MSMASDINDDPDTLGASVPPGAQHLVHHQICQELFMARTGVTPAQACGVGCSTCGVIDASPARCEQCTGAHRAADHSVAAAEMVSAHRPAAACNPMGCAVGAPPHCARQACRCGPEGCADSSCPGRSAIQHLAAEDTEGGAA